MARYLDTVSDEVKSRLFQALGSKLTLEDLEKDPREITEQDAQDLGEKLTNEWQAAKMAECLEKDLGSGENYIDSCLIEEFGSEEDKSAYAAWKLAQE